jgi:hypothetical protein
MTDLAKLVVKLEAQTAQYMAQLDKANKRLEKFDKSASISAKNIAAGVAAAVSGAVVAFAAMSKSAIDAADDLSKMAQSTGVSTETLSQLKYAADLSGTSMEGLNTSLRKLQKAQADAARGSDTAQKAFDALGVSATNADGSLKSTDELLLDVADRFSQMEDGAAKAALAQELFGKSGADLIPFLNQGRAGIKALTDEADRFGLTVSTKAGKAAEEFNDNLSRAQAVFNGLANQAAEQLLPTFAAITTNFIESAKAGGALEAAVKGLAVILKTLVTAGIVVVSVFEQLGRAIYGNAQALQSLVQGDFKAAAQAYKDTFTDIKQNVTEDLETIAQVWSDTVPQVEGAATQIDNTLKETLIFNDEKAEDAAKKAADSALKEIKRLEQGLREQVETFNMSEEATIRYRIAQGDLSETFREAGAAAEPYKETIIELTAKLEDLKKEAEETDEFMRGIDESIKKDIERNREIIEGELETMIEVKDEMDKFEERAKENIQDILATGIEESLEGGVKKGADGALDAFMDMLQKMAIQAIAADIAGYLFGEDSTGFGGSGSGGGGLWGDIADIGMSWFGGSRDQGGRGRKGQAYLIGRGAQPELFVPDTAGEFIPAGAWAGSGGQKLTQNIYVQGRVDQRSARQLELEASRRQRSASMRLG